MYIDLKISVLFTYPYIYMERYDIEITELNEQQKSNQFSKLSNINIKNITSNNKDLIYICITT